MRKNLSPLIQTGGAHIQQYINNLMNSRQRHNQIQLLRAKARQVDRPNGPRKNTLVVVAVLAMSF
jgi:hypothetical protein